MKKQFFDGYLTGFLGLRHALYQQANDLAVILSRKLFTRSWTEERLNDITAQVLREFGNDTGDEEGK